MVTAQADFPDFGGYTFYMWKDARFVAFWVYQLPSVVPVSMERDAGGIHE